MTGRAALLLAIVLAAPSAHAAGLTSQSVTYEVKLPADADKTVFAEGQGTYSLSKSCEGWTLGEVYQFGIEKGPAGPPKQIGPAGFRLEERVSAKESLDGRTLSYQSRLRLNARITNATGKVAPGKLEADLGTYTQRSDLPADTLGPAAARAALVEALLANKPDPIEIRTVDMLRFHKPIMQHFQRAPPEFMISSALPKELRASDKDFAKGRTWAVRRRVNDFNETGDEFWLIHESGAVVRQLVKRQGASLLLEAREVTLFPAPKCD